MWPEKDILGGVTCSQCNVAALWCSLCACLSVCWSQPCLRCAKTNEPIEMPFGVWTRVVPRMASGSPKGKSISGALPCDAASCQNSLTTCLQVRSAARTADTDGVIAAAAEIVRRARLRGLGEDEPVSVHGGRAALRRGQVQAEAARGAGRGRRIRRYDERPVS